MPCVVEKQKYKKQRHFTVGTNDQNGLHSEFDTLAEEEKDLQG